MGASSRNGQKQVEPPSVRGPRSTTSTDSVTPEQPLVTVDRIDGTTVLRFETPFIDTQFRSSSQQIVQDQLQRQQTVVLDVSQVRYIDYVRFEWLLDCLRQAQGYVVFGGVHPCVESMFILARLGTIDRFPNVAQAVDAVAASSLSR